MKKKDKEKILAAIDRATEASKLNEFIFELVEIVRKDDLRGCTVNEIFEYMDWDLE